MARVTISSNNLFPGPKGQKGDTGAQGPSGVIAVTSPITNSGSSTSATIGIDQSLIGIAQSQVTNLTSDLAAKAGLALANTFTTSPQQINGAASAKGLIIKMSATTPNNPLEIQNSAATVLAKIDASGNLFAPTLQSTTASTATLTTNGDTGGFRIDTGADANKGLVIRRNSASQAANLQEWQNQDGIVAASIDRFGRFNSITAGNFGTLVAGSTNLGVASTAATLVGFIVRGIANQTADLIQVINSAGTVIAGNNAVGQSFTGSTTPIFSQVGGAVTGASGTGTTATVTLTSAPNLAVGDLITVAGINPSGYNATNVLVTAVSNTSPFSVSYANTTTAAWVSGGTVSAPAQASVVARSSGTVPLLVRTGAATGSGARPFVLQNSSGTILAYIDNYGGFYGAGIGTTNQNGGYISTNNASPIQVSTASTTIVPLSVKAIASQTANLQEWQNSAGTRLSIVNAGGSFNIGGSTAPKSVLSITQGGSAPTSPTLGTASGGFYLSNFDAAYGLLGGVVGTGNVWLQVQRTDSSATAYDLHLQPSGGRVAIAKTTASSALDVNGTITASQQIISIGGTNGIGYGTGAGGTVTQATDKTTGVTLSKVTGQITMNGAALAADTTVSFTLTNTAIAATDVVHVQHISAGTLGAYVCTAAPAAGSATVYVRNITAGSLSEAIVLQFVVIKAVTA